MDRGAWWDIVYEVARVGHDLATKLLLLPRSLAFVLTEKKKHTFAGRIQNDPPSNKAFSNKSFL